MWLYEIETKQFRYVQHTVSQKKRHPFYFCDIFDRRYPIFPILGRNIPQGIWNKHIIHNAPHLNFMWLEPVDYKICVTLRYKNGCTRPKSRTWTSYENALWTNGISQISASLTKPLQSGKRDFKLVWLQKEDSLNIRCEHFSLLTFSHLIFLKGSLFKLTVCCLIKMCVMHFNYASQKCLTNKHTRIYDKLEYFLANTAINFR